MPDNIYDKTAEKIKSGISAAMVITAGGSSDSHPYAGRISAYYDDGSMVTNNLRSPTEDALKEESESARKALTERRSCVHRTNSGPEHSELTFVVLYIEARDIRYELLFRDFTSKKNIWLILKLTEKEECYSAEAALTDGEYVFFSREIQKKELVPLLWNRIVWNPGNPSWLCLPGNQ